MSDYNSGEFEEEAEASVEAELGSPLTAAKAKVLGELERLKKTGENKHFNYKYAQEADLFDALRPLLSKYGIAPSWTYKKRPRVLYEETTRSNQTSRTFEVCIIVTLTHESGESEDSTVYGYGASTDEKGPYKALTGAFKYWSLKTFLMSTGEDDPERDSAKTLDGHKVFEAYVKQLVGEEHGQRFLDEIGFSKMDGENVAGAFASILSSSGPEAKARIYAKIGLIEEYREGTIHLGEAPPEKAKAPEVEPWVELVSTVTANARSIDDAIHAVKALERKYANGGRIQDADPESLRVALTQIRGFKDIPAKVAAAAAAERARSMTVAEAEAAAEAERKASEPGQANKLQKDINTLSELGTRSQEELADEAWKSANKKLRAILGKSAVSSEDRELFVSWLKAQEGAESLRDVSPTTLREYAEHLDGLAVLERAQVIQARAAEMREFLEE